MARILLGQLLPRLVLGLMGIASASCGPERTNVLVPDGSESFVVMDFSSPLPLDPPPPGWHHRKFRTRAPMEMSFATRDAVPALRLATSDGASMLARFVDVDLDRYPILRWRWYVEKGIESDLDERTAEGDDHPARLYLVLEDRAGKTRKLEIIWGNAVLEAGDYKPLKGPLSFLLGSFPNYVANGGDENIGCWHDEAVDLSQIYHELWDDPRGARIKEIALFCDSDETDDSTVAYFAQVRVQQSRHEPRR